MHSLWYHSKAWQEHQRVCYQHSKHQWHKKTYFVDDMYTPDACTLPYHQDFLTYHDYFQFFHFDIFFYKKHGLTIQEIASWVEDKQRMIEQRRWVQPHLYKGHYFHSIYVDGVPKSYLLGQSWDMFCRLAFLYLSPKGQELYETIPAVCRRKGLCHWYPYDYFTLRALRSSLKKENFALLTIQDHDINVSIIKNGYYTNHATLNMGIHALKDMYDDNNIAHLFYTPSDQLNATSEKIVKQTVQFFVTMLIQRLQDHITCDYDVILVSSLVRNDMFVQELDMLYQERFHRFLLPFTHSDNLSPCGREWLPQEIHVLSAVNLNKHWKKYRATLEWSLG